MTSKLKMNYFLSFFFERLWGSVTGCLDSLRFPSFPGCPLPPWVLLVLSLSPRVVPNNISIVIIYIFISVDKFVEHTINISTTNILCSLSMP